MFTDTVNLRLFFNQCILCRYPAEHPSAICTACYQDLPWLQQACQRCALPLHTHSEPLTCADCLVQPPSFEKTTALFHYRFPINSLIGKVKYSRQPQFIGHLARLFIDRLTPEPDLECLIPIPMHRYNHFLRGFNQAELLAQELSRLLGIPCRTDLLLKKVRTSSQRGLPRAERLKNQRQAFSCQEISYQRVLLIDDVMTTGATLEAASRALKKAGSQHVDCAVLARTDF